MQVSVTLTCQVEDSERFQSEVYWSLGVFHDHVETNHRRTKARGGLDAHTVHSLRDR
jgi:hypothetical protein